MTNLGPNFDFNTVPELTSQYQRFSSAVVAANQSLVKGYKNLATQDS
jgi:hypothetical protein